MSDLKHFVVGAPAGRLAQLFKETDAREALEVFLMVRYGERLTDLPWSGSSFTYSLMGEGGELGGYAWAQSPKGGLVRAMPYEVLDQSVHVVYSYDPWSDDDSVRVEREVGASWHVSAALDAVLAEKGFLQMNTDLAVWHPKEGIPTVHLSTKFGGRVWDAVAEADFTGERPDL